MVVRATVTRHCSFRPPSLAPCCAEKMECRTPDSGKNRVVGLANLVYTYSYLHPPFATSQLKTRGWSGHGRKEKMGSHGEHLFTIEEKEMVVMEEKEKIKGRNKWRGARKGEKTAGLGNL